MQVSRLIDKKALNQIPPLENDDLDKFLNMFKRIVNVHNYLKEMWASLLISKLRGTILAAVNFMPVTDVTKYDTLCDKLKQMFKLQPEAYATRFKEAQPTFKQTYVEFSLHLRS
jgi:hypothetical protein